MKAVNPANLYKIWGRSPELLPIFLKELPFRHLRPSQLWLAALLGSASIATSERCFFAIAASGLSP
jgi:hypothetical protein